MNDRKPEPAIPKILGIRTTQLVNVAGMLRGYIAIWGNPQQTDAFDTWFDRARPPFMGIDGGMHQRPILYEHAQDARIGKAIIGQIDRVFFDDTGIGYEGHLDRSSPHFPRIVAELQAGLLATSSGTMQHTADFYEDGAFRTWILGELSLTKSPAEPHMPATQIVRSAEEARDVLRAGRTALEIVHKINQINERASTMTPEQLMAQLIALGMTPEQVAVVMQQMQAATAPTQSAPDVPEEEIQPTPSTESAQTQPVTLSSVMNQTQPRSQAVSADDIAALRERVRSLEALVQRPVETSVRQAQPRGESVRASVSEPRLYDGKSNEDLLLAHRLMRAERIQPSEEFLRIVTTRAAHAAEKEQGAFRDPFVRRAMGRFVRANEVATSTATGAGDEWVSIAWSTQIWEKVRSVRIIDQLRARGMRMEEVPQGAETIYILTEGADPTVYTLAQNPDANAVSRPSTVLNTTRIGTGRIPLTPGELGLAVVWTRTLDEDSIINISSQYQQQITEKAQETVEQLFLNGDAETGANANINLIDGTPGTGLSTPYYIASNGALKYALVTGSGTSRDGGSLDETDFRLTHKLLPAAIRAQRQRCVFVIDPDTHSAALDIPAIKTDDVKRTNATITSGELANIYGIDVIESGFLELANSAGKISATPGNNTKGRIIEIYAPYWAMGNKRAIDVETDRDILSQTNIIVATMRLGFVPRGAGAAVATYNVTV